MNKSKIINSIFIFMAAMFLVTCTSIQLASKMDNKTIRNVVQIGHYMDLAVLSPDDKYLVSGSYSGSIKIWDISSGKLFRTLNAHSDEILSLTFSQNGLLMASSSDDNSIKIWDAKNWDLIHDLEFEDYYRKIIFSPNGNSLAACSWKEISFFNTISGDLIQTITPENQKWDIIDHLEFSPDGAEIIISSDHKAYKYKVSTASHQLSIEHSGAEKAMYSPDGKFILFLYLGKELVLIEASTGERIWITEREKSGDKFIIINYTFIEDGGKIILANRNNCIEVFDSSDGSLISKTPGKEIKVSEVLFTKMDNLVISIPNQDSEILGAQVWNLETAEEILSIKGFRDFVDLYGSNFSADGKLIIHTTSTGDDIFIQEKLSGRIIKKISGESQFICAVFSSDSTKIIAGTQDGKIKIFDAQNGQEEESWPIRQPIEDDTAVPVFAVVNSHDGTMIASFDRNRIVKIWDMYSGELLKTINPDPKNIYINTLINFSPDDRTLLMGGLDLFYFIDVSTGTLISKIPASSSSESLNLFSPNGKSF
jgi:WD40 repeat protein